MTQWIIVVLTLAVAGFAVSEEHSGALPAHAKEAGTPAPSQHPHPIIPSDATWAGVLVIVILMGFFLPAAVIGPIARTLAPEDEPVTESHDEPPGASHHHGPEGTDEDAHARH